MDDLMSMFLVHCWVRMRFQREREREREECFGLSWPGKAASRVKAQTSTTATLTPEQELSRNWDSTRNVFIEGDNLEVLKILQKHYHGRVKLIYIDPPYNTGKDFVYSDRFSDGLTTYLEYTKQADERGKLDSNPETNGRFHSNWLNMMYPRLLLARNLLADDGVIFISIDDNEIAHLRDLCDLVFGEVNLVGTLVVIRAEGGGLAKNLIRGHDYLVAYARKIAAFPPLMRPKDIRGEVVIVDDEQYWIETDWLRKEFGKYGTCPYEEIASHLGADKKAEIDIGLKEGRYILLPRDGKHIVGRYRKVSEDGSRFYSVVKHLSKEGIHDLAELGGMDSYFEYPKPLSLLKEIIRGATFFTSKRNDIVLDLFAGSGTTAQAVMDLNASDGGNRRFILVQLPEPTSAGSEAHKDGYGNIADISRERIRRAAAKIFKENEKNVTLRETPLDLGFRSYRLTDTHLSKWRATSETNVDELQETITGLANSIQEDASSSDLLTELLLKLGYGLDEQLEERSIAGLPVTILWRRGDIDNGSTSDGSSERNVGNVPELIALTEQSRKPTLEQIRSTIALKPRRLLMIDDCFRGNDALKVNIARICADAGIELRTA